MTAPNRNTFWANTFVNELALAGVRAACIAPGSRSTPLTVAFANHPDITVYSLLDERGAAFFALGMALATNQPAALVCTSGTATANFYPAIIEANNAQVPLLVLTTDRPPELRHSGANQTIDQIKMYGDHVRWFVDVALPEANTPALSVRSLQTLACRAVAKSVGLPPGPVHLNFPFRKPLEPIPVPGDVPETNLPEPAQTPITSISCGSISPSDEQVDLLVEAVKSGKRGLIVCGPRCPGSDFPQAVTQLARASGYPILADTLSGVRFGPHVDTANVTILSGYETFLPNIAAEPPEVILRFGAMPISKAANDLLANNSATHRILMSENGVWQDDTHSLTDFIWADPSLVCRAVAEQLAANSMPPRNESWLSTFQNAEEQTWQTFDKMWTDTFFEGVILADVVEQMPQESLLFVAASLPLRHLNQFARPNQKNLRVFANRGASGIDGTIASALGVAAASDRPLTLVIGDLAFYHDMNSLLALKRCGVNITIVLINNNGGGIFHRLPISNFDPPFTDLFITPHGLEFEPVVRMFGVEYARAENRAEFLRVFDESVGSDTSWVIEIPTDSVLHEKMRRQLIQAVANKL